LGTQPPLQILWGWFVIAMLLVVSEGSR